MFNVARRVRSLFLAIAAAAMVSSPAWAASYVDTGLKDLTAEQKAVVADPKPVQLLFQFNTKGAPNARATKFLKKQVTEIVQASGAFSEVAEGPVAGGAILSVSIDNLMEEGAAAKGFMTGLTFGLKGSAVSDLYICTVEYLPSSGEKVTKTAQHAIHTTIGISEAPPNGEKVKNVNEAVTIMVRQIVSNALNSVAADPGFSGQAPAAVVPAEAEAEAEAAPTPEAAPAAELAPAAEPEPAQ